jgi:NAD(P)-dependent dehydrogenase (short-subunit alcohol dehydrogenase family)
LSSILLIGGETGVSKELEKLFANRGWDVRRVDWPDRKSWDTLHKNILETLYCCNVSLMIVVSHLRSFYPNLFELLRNTPKDRGPSRVYIIGSTTSDRIKSKLDIYNIEKKILAELVLQVQQDLGFIPVSLIRPGAIDTPRVAHLKGPKLTSAQVASVIAKIIEMENIHKIKILNFKFIREDE